VRTAPEVGDAPASTVSGDGDQTTGRIVSRPMGIPHQQDFRPDAGSRVAKPTRGPRLRAPAPLPAHDDLCPSRRQVVLHHFSEQHATELPTRLGSRGQAGGRYVPPLTRRPARIPCSTCSRSRCSPGLRAVPVCRVGRWPPNARPTDERSGRFAGRVCGESTSAKADSGSPRHQPVLTVVVPAAGLDSTFVE
jgi:hypothetical protein